MTITRNVTRNVTRGVTWGATSGQFGLSPSLHYDFTQPTLAAKTGPTLDIVRATTATMTDADGWIREVQSGEARFQGATFSQNLCTKSSDLADVAWTSSGTSMGTAETDPFGGTLAYPISEDNTTGEHRLSREQTFPIDRQALVSIYAKASNRDWSNESSRRPS